MKPCAFLRNILIFCMPSVLLCTACNAQQSKEPFSSSLAPAYSIQADMTYGERDSHALCKLSRQNSGIWEAEFTEPSSLSGVILTFEENAVSANYKGLAFTVPKSALPAKSMLMLMTDVFDALGEMESLPCKEADNNQWKLEGESEGGSYTVMFDENGVPMQFSVPSQPLSITFSEYTVQE